MTKNVQGFVSAVHPVPLDFLESVAGQVVELPVQTSARSHSPAAARHTVPALPAGCWQSVLVPLQVSVVQALPSSGHDVVFGLGEQVPTSPVRLQAAHWSVQVVSQQTLLTQLPLAH